MKRWLSSGRSDDLTEQCIGYLDPRHDKDDP
jgi:hypothetical protein